MVKSEIGSDGGAPDPSGIAAPAVKFGFFTALSRYRDYRYLWVSTVLTQIAQWMFQVTLGWLMFELTQQATWVGLIGFASGIPFLLISVPAGVLIDRLDRRAVLVFCQGAVLVVGIALLALVALGLAQPWHLLLAAFLNAASLAANNATRQTLVPSFVPREHLQNAIALISAGQNSTRIVGPALAGPTIAAVGASGAFALQAIVLLAALIATLPLPAVRTHAGPAVALRTNLVEGFTYILRSPALSGIILLAAIPTLTVFPYIQFLPVYASDILDIGADGLGLLLTMSGVGAVTGALIVAGIGGSKRKGPIMLLSCTVYCGLVAAFAYSQLALLSMLLLMLVGVSGSLFMSMNNTLLHLNVSDQIRGRVMGIYMLTWGLSPIGALPIGYLGDRVGLPHVIGIGALLTGLASVVLFVRSRTLRAL